MSKAITVEVGDQRIDLEVKDGQHWDPVRELVAAMVKREIGFDQYENRVSVIITVRDW